MCGTYCLIAPPDVLVKIAEEGAPAQRDSALRTLATSVALRAQRATVGNALRTLDAGDTEKTAGTAGPGLYIFRITSGDSTESRTVLVED